MFCKKKTLSVLDILERLLLALVTIPPIYMGMRYLRWYFRQKNESDKALD